MQRSRLEPRDYRASRQSYEHIEVRPCSAVIGADVGGVDLSRPLGALVLAELKRAFLEWKVLFFRDQNLTPRQHADFASLWGGLYVNPQLPNAGLDEVARLIHDAADPGNENMWHSDASHWEKPPLGSILRAVEVPDLGGDTMWADMAAAYDGLPPDIKDRLVGLTAVHEPPAHDALSAALRRSKAARARLKFAEHPVLREHPETGQGVLYVNPVFTSHICGLPRSESDELLEFLFRQVTYPEYQVRFRWRAGSIAFWDNRATLHYGVNDYFPRRRVLERTTVLGDRPQPLPAQE